MIKAREHLDTNSIQQQLFEQNVLMHLKGLQMRALGGWSLGSISFKNGMLLNSYDHSYLLQLVLGLSQSFENDIKLNTRQISQIAKMLRTLPPHGISLKLDLGGINQRIFLRMLKSIFRKLRHLSDLSFKPVECQSSSWLGVLSALKKSQPKNVVIQMRESQFYKNKEKMRNVFLKLFEKAEELSFESYPLKLKSRISWFADTQRMMDVFRNLRKIHLDPFVLEDSYCYNYQRLFDTMSALEDVSLMCYNRDYFRKMTSYLVLPEKLRKFQITFINLCDKESWRNILNNILSKQQLPQLETLQIAIKFKPIQFFPSQKVPIINEFSMLEGLHCPNLKTLKLKLALIQRVSLLGLEKLTKLGFFELEVNSSVKKISFAEGNPFPSSLKKFSFVYCAEKPLLEHKSEVYYLFWAFLNKKAKELGQHLISQLSELILTEVVVGGDIVKATCQECLETLVLTNCIIMEKEFKNLLNSDRLVSLRCLQIQSSQLRDNSVVNNEKIIHLIAESSLANRLEELSILCTSFSEGDLQDIQLDGLSFPKLRKLDLSQNINLTLEGLIKVFQINMPRLEYLNIAHIKCSYTDLQGFLIERLASLKELKLDANDFEIENSSSSAEFRRKFLKLTNYGLFTSRT